MLFDRLLDGLPFLPPPSLHAAHAAQDEDADGHDEDDAADDSHGDHNAARIHTAASLRHPAGRLRYGHRVEGHAPQRHPELSGRAAADVLHEAFVASNVLVTEVADKKLADVLELLV